MAKAGILERETLQAFVDRGDPGAHLLGAWPLTGGVSASVTALEVERPDGSRRRYVVKRHGPGDLAWNPEVARHEFELLRLLRGAGLAVPPVLWLDAEGSLGSPGFLAEFVGGDGLQPPDPGPAMALQLAAIHALPVRGLAFLSRRDRQGETLLAAAPPAEAAAAEAQSALRVRWPWPRAAADCLLHGDFWIGNLVWDDGRIAAVIDWEDAGLGDPLADLAYARLELLWSHGEGVMAGFTDAYLAAAGREAADLPLWDLMAVLDKLPRLGGWGLAAAQEATMRAQTAAFAAAALRRL